MQNVLAWTKANPISVVSILVAVVAIGVLVWVHINGRSFVEDMTAQGGKVTQVERYMNQSVQVPGKTPQDPPRTVSRIVINQPAIEQLEAVFAKMDGEYKSVFEIARNLNRTGREPMLPNLFPVPSQTLRYAAKDEYPKILTAMIGLGNPSSSLPALNAKPPIDQNLITEELARIEQQYRQENAIAAQGGFDEDQYKVLADRKRERLQQMLVEHAQSISMYAQPEIGPDFPFDIPGWVGETRDPNEIELWTGQMMLWIQQDIAAAIALANEGRNVTESVVKRLIRMNVVRGPVGIRNRGGLNDQSGSSGQPYSPETYNPQPQDPNAAPAPVSTGDTRLPDDFAVSPTGRSSNAIYDVWHVWVEMVVDSQELPTLFNALGKVNFMTVLSMEVTDVDEYAALREGFVYGPGDAVHVKMLVETIWLRDWTTRLMPALVKQMLGIAPVEGSPQG